MGGILVLALGQQQHGPGKAAEQLCGVLRRQPGPVNGRGPGSERQGAPRDDARMEPISGECRGWNTEVFFAVDLSSVKSAVASPEFRRIGAVSA